MFAVNLIFCPSIKNTSCNRLAREKKPSYIRSCALLRVSHVVAGANKSRLYSQAGNTRHKHVTNYGGVKLGESDILRNHFEERKIIHRKKSTELTFRTVCLLYETRRNQENDAHQNMKHSGRKRGLNKLIQFQLRSLAL